MRETTITDSTLKECQAIGQSFSRLLAEASDLVPLSEEHVVFEAVPLVTRCPTCRTIRVVLEDWELNPRNRDARMTGNSEPITP